MTIRALTFEWGVGSKENDGTGVEVKHDLHLGGEKRAAKKKIQGGPQKTS